MKLVKLEPPKTTTGALLLGGAVTAGAALVGAGLGRAFSKPCPPSNRLALCGPDWDTFMGAVEWTAGATVVGIGLAVFSPKWRMTGLGMVGTMALAATAKALVSGPEAQAQTSPVGPGTPHVIQLIPGQTIILRAQVGDFITVLAPSGWGVPSATANIPGFLQIESTSDQTESTVLQVMDKGAGQISMSLGGETAILSIDVS